MKLETKLRIAKEMYKEKEKKSEKIKEPKQEFKIRKFTRRDIDILNNKNGKCEKIYEKYSKNKSEKLKKKWYETIEKEFGGIENDIKC
jgi:hypothetical protein